MNAVAALFQLLELLLRYNSGGMMQELTRAVVLLIALQNGTADDTAADELAALEQTLKERSRVLAAAPYHTTPRGLAALERAATAATTAAAAALELAEETV